MAVNGLNVDTSVFWTVFRKVSCWYNGGNDEEKGDSFSHDCAGTDFKAAGS